MMQFTLVSTVFNESKRLEQTIDDLSKQTLQPSEIIVTDAGSNDGTYDILLEWKRKSPIPIVILQKAKCNVAEGRNMAIRAATYGLIASTDFGCRFDPDWLKSIITPFNDPAVNVVGGAFTVDETDQDTLASQAAYILSNGYVIDVHAPWFIPSSRSIAYKKEVFDNIGGYCEWLTLAADDLVFGKELKAKGYQIHISDKPCVFWGRHKVAKGFVKEANRYGLGDGEANVNTRSFLSNLIEMILRYCLFISLVLIIASSLFVKISFWAFVPVIIFLPGLRSYVNYTRNWLRLKSSKYNFRVYLYGIYLLEQTRISYIKGYLKGYFKSTPFQKEQAKLLTRRLAVKS